MAAKEKARRRAGLARVFGLIYPITIDARAPPQSFRSTTNATHARQPPERLRAD
jgi:hypothetical protein